MKAHITNNFKGFGIDNETIDQLSELLDMPDERFAAISKISSANMKELYNTPEFESQIREALKMHPITDLDSEISGLKESIKQIDEESELSVEKKEFLKGIINGTMDNIIRVMENPREKIAVKIEKINSNAIIPTYAHPTDAGADVTAAEAISIAPGETKLVHTGLKMAIPAGYEVQVRPRSGLSLKTGLRVANAPGTVDSNYRGEVCIIMTNTGSETENINVGDKIAQLLIALTPMMVFTETTVDDNTDRGTGGFGSTDKS